MTEQGETLPARSVAVAWKVVVVPAATVTGRPGDAKSLAVPCPAGALAHAASAYNLTIEFASALPVIRGFVSLAGEAGTVAVNAGGAGGEASSMNTNAAPGPMLGWCAPASMVLPEIDTD